jgi:hypothetical protein
MEEGVRNTLAAVICLIAGPALAQEGSESRISQLEKTFPKVSKNAAAEDLDVLGRALGFDSEGETAEDNPTKEDRDELLNAGHGSWLDAQLAASDDSILAAPPRFIEFLERKQGLLWRVVNLLEKETPDWGFDLHKGRSGLPPELLFVSQLNRLLLSAALVEERDQRHALAADLLEASWSLNRSVAQRPETIYQMIAVATQRSIAGVVRKMSEPLPQWQDRMESREPIQNALNSLGTDTLIYASQNGTLTDDYFRSMWIRVPRLVAENLSDTPACEISRMPSDEIWGPAIEELRKSATEEEDLELDIMGTNSAPNITNSLHRAARLVVESELTARIVELRLEKAASRHNRWPATLYDIDSRVCPGAQYEYRSVAGGMTIRFSGSLGKLEAPRLLPLSFEARAPKPSPTITPTSGPSPTPTPGPSLTPGKAGA